MDPLSIVASVVAISQATERVGGLLSGIAILFNASKDIPLLAAEVAIIKRALEGLLSAARESSEQFGTLAQPVAVCLRQVLELEDIISTSLPTTDTSEDLAVQEVNRMAWMRNSRKVKRTKHQLKEGISAIQFELLSLNLFGQLRLAASVDDLTHIAEKLQNSLNFHFGVLQGSLIPSIKDMSSIDGRYREVEDLEQPKARSISFQTVADDEDTIPFGGESQSYSEVPITGAHMTHGLCSCPCNCHRKKIFKTSRIFNAILGIILLEWTGNPLIRTPCNSAECTKRSIPYLSITYYGRWWSSNTAFSVTFREDPSPCLSLSFPRFLPPDAEIFVSIRLGKLDHIKALLIEGRASVADVLLPYGISTLALANLHGQTEICKLLISAGANTVVPLAPGSLGNELWIFWDRFYSQDYSISALEMLSDSIHQISTVNYARNIAKLGVEPSHESQSFTRLHKSVLGLTSEPIESLLHSSSLEVNETDSLGRTALHLAAYRCDSSTINLLLRQKANPNITDQTGKTPLHISAALGFVSCTSTLINGGADLNADDPFGATPFHHACISGQEKTARLLLDAGANQAAVTSIHETPLRHCILSDRPDIMKMFYEHGDNFEEQDRMGSAAIHDAIWFNSHQALRFLLGIRVRMDQRMNTGKTILHVLAENADLQTMEIFAEMYYPDFGSVTLSSLDKKGFTAAEYFKMRNNSDESLAKAFQVLVESFERPRRFDSRIVSCKLGEEKMGEEFFDAVEFQCGN